MKMYSRLIVIILIAITVNGIEQNNNLNYILQGVFRQQDLTEEQIGDVIFFGSFSYIEINASGDTTKTINSLRRIYSKGSEKQKSEYLEMVIDGKKLTKMQIEKQTKKNQSAENFKLPFYKKFRNDYDFFYIGEDTNEKVWIIGFRPRYKKAGYLNGSAQISQFDTTISQIQFQPMDLPSVVKHFNCTLNYSKYQNYSLPSKFSLEMEIRVKVILNLAHKFIKMQEIYSEYQFHQSLPDSLFD
ncbi:MAG: hypothetical protein N2201_03860 [candidate division WOR-3 bacterium]|nr:hypothetical protein [candidate division WOR-3 bacterium]